MPCILKEFAYKLAEPVTTIFNASLASGIVLAICKDSNIIPVPKIQPPTNEGDFTPISLTPCLSKVLRRLPQVVGNCQQTDRQVRESIVLLAGM